MPSIIDNINEALRICVRIILEYVVACQREHQCIVFSDRMNYISPMNNLLKKIIYIALIACYSFGATVGNVIVLRELLNSGDKNHQLTAESKSREIPVSPVWTIKKHFPPSIQSDISSHFILFNDIFVLNKSSRIYVYTDYRSKYTYLECLPSKPRDPPLT